MPWRVTVLTALLLFCVAFAGGAAGAQGDACPNAQLRQGFSATLPDCRAYELVTPPETNGVLLQATYAGSEAGRFAYSPVAANGGDVFFNTAVGSLPGLPAGQGNGESYQALRGPSGWSVSNVSPSFAEANHAGAGPFSADHRYQFWRAVDGSLDFNPQTESPFFGSTVVRGPDGGFSPLGHGSLGDDPNAAGVAASPDGGHLIFRTGTVRAGFLIPAVQLETLAAPAPTFALYDRTADGATHVVSLLPGNVQAAPGENAYFAGASADGSVVLFCLNSEEPNGSARCETTTTLYARIDNEVTKPVTTGNWTPAGVSADGAEVFYVEGGNIFAFDTAAGSTRQITSSGDTAPVNISADGSHVYFVSPSQLDGANGVAGESNLYVWSAASGTTRFVATLAESDVNGEISLTRWPEAAGPNGEVARDPSRTTPDGSILAFESAAQLTSFDNGGHTEVYRYDSGDERLVCASCGAIGPAVGNAHLQNDSRSLLVVFDTSVVTHNLSDDGKRLFFETPDALVAADVDEAQDVYEWEAGGSGTCQQASGCVELISSGHSPRAQNPPLFGGEERPTNFFYGATPDGHDAFILTRDGLLPGAGKGDLALYDARVDGGFPLSASAPCSGDGCQGEPLAPPQLGVGASSTFHGRGNVKPRHCHRHGKKQKRCRRHRHRHHHRAHQGGNR